MVHPARRRPQQTNLDDLDPIVRRWLQAGLLLLDDREDITLDEASAWLQHNHERVAALIINERTPLQSNKQINRTD